MAYVTLSSLKKREETWKQVCVGRNLDITMNAKGNARKWSQMYKPHADFYLSLSPTSHGEDHDFNQDSCTSSTVSIYAPKQL